MSIEVTTAPAEEPLTTDEAKAHLRIDGSEEEALIDAAVSAARHYAENKTRLKLITQSLTITQSGFGPAVRLPFGNVQSVTSVQYKDATTGAMTVLAADQYQLVKSCVPNFITPAYLLSWPTVRHDWDSVVVEVVAGFGGRGDVPLDIIAAIKLLTSHFYENRQEEFVGTITSKLSLGADRLLMPHVFHI